MKRQLLVILFLAYAISSSAQQTDPATPTHKTDYLKKSKSQNTAAWILLGGGFTLTTTGMIVGWNEFMNDVSNIFSAEEQNSSNTGAVLFYTGLASMISSIPLFIASSSNKRKAGNVSLNFKLEKSTRLHEQAWEHASYPALALKLRL